MPRASAAALAAATNASDRPAAVVLAELHEPLLLVGKQVVLKPVPRLGEAAR
jgi:hypothetical protein